MKLGIGTVQFGMDYGISNLNGKCSLKEVGYILQEAYSTGVEVIDTAALYGESEQALGNYLQQYASLKVITKTPKFSNAVITQKEADLLETTFFRSLDRLHLTKVYGLLTHDADDLLRENGQLLFNRMETLKSRGFVKKIGVSVYNIEQLEQLTKLYKIDLVQLPLNVLDQRFFLKGSLQELKAKDIEIHVRSVFLQGLLLIEPDKLSSNFESIRELLTSYHNYIRENGLSPVEGALSFISSIEEIDHFIIGVTSPIELQQIVSALTYTGKQHLNLDSFACFNEAIINPSKWFLK